MDNQEERRQHSALWGTLCGGATRLGELSVKKSKPWKQYLLAFFLPFCIVGIVWAIGGVWPFGSNMILVQDMWHQYYPFLVDLRQKLIGGGSLFYSWTTGMGCNYLSLFAYYLASPLNLLTVFVPENLLLSYFALEVLLKISCAGLFFAIFARKTLGMQSNALPFFALMYALCSFIMGYYWNTMWLDTVALLPLVVCGTVALLRDKKFILYTVSLALAVVINYYAGLFVCIFVLLLFIGYNVCNWDGFGGFFRRLCRIGLFTGLALGMTALLTLPAYFGLQSASSTMSNALPNQYAINIGGSNDLMGVIDAFRKVIANAGAVIPPTSRDGLPNVACGVATLLLALVFFTCKKIKLREKLCCGLLLLFFIYSFISRRLDFLWHGGHFPNMLPYRFSFLYCFTVVAMAVRAYTQLDRLKWYHIACIAPFLLTFLFCVFSEAGKRSLLVTALIVAVGCALLVLFSLKKLKKQWLSLLLCLCLLAEGLLNGAIGVDQVSLTTRKNYPPAAQDVKNVIAQMEERESGTLDLYRTEVTETKTLNDNALNGFNGISVFSSAVNAKMSAFLATLGMGASVAGNRYAYQQADPMTNLLLNLKYLISRDGQYDDHVNFREVASSGNVLLLENKNYLPLGWMLEDSLLQYDTTQAEGNRNRFENLNSLYQLATGAHDKLYTDVPISDMKNSGACTVTKTGTDLFSVRLDEASEADFAGKNYVELEFRIPQDCSLCLYGKTGSAGKSLADIDIYIDGTLLRSENVRYGYVMYLSSVKAGNTVSVRLEPSTAGEATMRLCLAEFDEEAFAKMYDKLSQSVMQMTKLTETQVEGTIRVKEAGLFFASIPADNGWSATVDGEQVEITPVGDALIAFHLEPGTHDIALSFETPGFSLGWKISLTCLLLFLLLVIVCLLRRVCTPGIQRVRMDMAERPKPPAMPQLTLNEEETAPAVTDTLRFTQAEQEALRETALQEEAPVLPPEDEEAPVLPQDDVTPAPQDDVTPAPQDEETPALPQDEETPVLPQDEETPAPQDEETPAPQDEEINE